MATSEHVQCPGGTSCKPTSCPCPPVTCIAGGCSITRSPTLSDLSTLRMPSLHCSFPALCHADYEAVKQACDAWIEAVVDPPSPSASNFLHNCLLPLLVCRSIPNAVSQQRLVHVIKAIAWLMIADDDDDDPSLLGSDFATTSLRAELVMAILHGVHPVDNSFDCSFLDNTRPGFACKCARMLKALAKLWHEIKEEMSPSLQTRLISTMADYFEGLKVQALFRKETTIPDVDSYMEIRRQASFTIPCFVFMEYALGIEIDDATFYHPLIQELRNVALDYISLCNDIVSSPIEVHMGDYFNLPSILYCNSSVVPLRSFSSFQEAMDHVAQEAQNLNDSAISLMSTIYKQSHGFEPHMVPLILAYVNGLSKSMSGTLAWFLETARYKQARDGSELHQLSKKDLSVA